MIGLKFVENENIVQCSMELVGLHVSDPKSRDCTLLPVPSLTFARYLSSLTVWRWPGIQIPTNLRPQ